MPDSPTYDPQSHFLCECAPEMKSACAGRERYHGQYQGKKYCVLHFPGKGKSAEFKNALQRKLKNKDFNFRGVWFPDPALFTSYDFEEEVDFFAATFSAEADFRSAKFSAAHFSHATFSGMANFRYATFSTVANFCYATFSAEADFRYAIFGPKANFLHATFADQVRFLGDETHSTFTEKSSLDLQFAIIEKPDHVSFHAVSLHPHWFVNVDASEFDFINVKWKNEKKTQSEIAILKSKGVSSAYRLFTITCRELASNAEENARYRQASHFRRMAMDAERLEEWRGFKLLGLSWWYWVASGYGERPFQAFIVLLGIWLLFGLLFTCVGFARWEPKLASEGDVVTTTRDNVGAPLKFSRALTYSAGVMTLQKPDPRPATTAAQAVVLLETVLGPVQAALLALAIRRKFMR